MSRRVLRLVLGSLAALLLASLFVAPHSDRRPVPGSGWLTGPLDANWLPGPGSAPGPTGARLTDPVGASRLDTIGTGEASNGRHERPAITNPTAPAPDQHLATGPAAALPAPRQPRTNARTIHAPALTPRLPHSIAPRAPPALLDR